MLLYKESKNIFGADKVRKCYECNQCPYLSTIDIQIEDQKGLKYIINNFMKTPARIGCCGVYYQGPLNYASRILKMWNNHTREIENKIKSESED